MRGNDEIIHLCQRLGLSESAKAVVDAIHSSPPTRRVRGASGNVTVRYPSRKMGVTIQAESHHNELAGIYEYEHDPATLAFYDQPPRIKLVYPDRNGRRIGVWHTPDFFVIRSGALGWEEWKSEEELGRLGETMPHRYLRGDDGRWRCPPGERYAEPFGFFYRVRSSAEIDWVFQRNLLFLEDYLRADSPPVDAHAADAILSLVRQRPGLPLNVLLQEVEGVTSDDIYALIAAERLFVDLHAAPLAEPERVRVFRDPVSAQAETIIATSAPPPPSGSSHAISLHAGTPVVWDGRRWTIVNPGQTTTTLLTEDQVLVELPTATIELLIGQGKLGGIGETVPTGISAEARECLAHATPADFAEANRRYAIIAPRLAGNASFDGDTSARTIRDWLARWRHAELVHSCGYVGLLPRLHRSGNRARKLPADTLALLDHFIATDYETLKQKPRFAVYAALAKACEDQGVTSPSYKTFTRAIHQRPRSEQVAKRQGPRAAAQHAAFYWELTPTIPRHGDRPFEIGHIDHTQLDIELACSRTGRDLGRPWATFLTDAFSRRLLAFALSFDPPSYRACMLVLRECVRRHQRLPQTVVVDGGAEFASVYFETLLARYECIKKTRPGAQPRFGSVCERLFGTTNTQFIHTLLGNTQILQNSRQVTRAVSPKEHRAWTLDRLFARLGEWADEIYDTRDHPALGQSPCETFTSGLLQSGARLQRLIRDDEDFRILTLPSTRKGTAKVQPRLGVKINYLSYWSETFVDPTVEGTHVAVRYDPFDAGLAYAFVQGRWVRCLSEYHAIFTGRSEREILLASAELRRRKQQHGQHLALTARKLADFLVSIEAEEVLLVQRLRDAAAKDLWREALGKVGNGPVTPPEVGSLPLPLPESDEVSPQEAESLIIYEDY